MSTGITPLTPQEEAVQENQAAHEGYIKRNLIALDDLGNTLIDGKNDETISSHSARAAYEGKRWGVILSKVLDWFQKDHGAKAVAGDTERAQAILDIENKSSIK